MGRRVGYEAMIVTSDLVRDLAQQDSSLSFDAGQSVYSDHFFERSAVNPIART